MVRVLIKELGVQSQVESYQKFLNMVLDASLLNTQHYKEWIKGKQRNPGKGVAPSLTPHVVAIEKGAFMLRLTMVGQFTYLMPNPVCTYRIFKRIFCR